MTRHSRLTGLFAAVAALTLSVSVLPLALVPASARAAEPGVILFEDDFTGPRGQTFDHTKWGDYGPCIHPIQAFGSIKCGDNETLTGDGQLSIPATPTAGSGLMTAGKFTFTYGTYSAWIKVPKTTGYWPALWTENRPADFSTTPLYGETDAVETYTWEPQYAHSGGFHAHSTEGKKWVGKDNYCTAPGVTNFGDAFHKYTVTIEPDKVTGFIDDVMCGTPTYRSSDPNRPWPFGPDRPNYVILDLAIGGAGGRQPTPPAADVMLVDRVEVRALPGGPSPTTTPVPTTAAPVSTPPTSAAPSLVPTPVTSQPMPTATAPATGAPGTTAPATPAPTPPAVTKAPSAPKVTKVPRKPFFQAVMKRFFMTLRALARR